jgi:IS5 family transposase
MSNEIFSLKQLGVSFGYKRIQKLGDRLEPISNLIDWNAFRKHFDGNSKIGRPPYDPVLMLKMIVLQSWYGISDQELEYQIADRITFQKFLGCPNEIPDYSTVWRFRELLSREGMLDKIWDELKWQMEKGGIKLSKGVIQDATFIAANPGKTNSGMSDRGRNQPSTRNEDGSWAKKGKKNYFGYKTHAKVDADNGIITEVAVTTASVHDSAIDLTKQMRLLTGTKDISGLNPEPKATEQ